MFIKKLGAWMALALLMAGMAFATGAHATSSDVTHVFLVQNSGWMEPFYVDPKSSFKPLVSEIIRRARGADESVVIASFNQGIGANRSPDLKYQGSSADNIKRAVDSIPLARKPGSNAFADTDFKEALVGAIRQYSSGKPSILWMFTNNKNSPQNSPETVAKNKEFYTWLQNEGQIKRIVAYPYKLDVKGKVYQANGAMIYAFAYGTAADHRLTQMLQANLPFGEQPVRLKPLNAEAITFVPKSAAPSQGYTVGLGRDKHTLILKFDGSARPQVAELSGNFRNDFNPYDIVSANVGLAVDFKDGARGVRADITPSALQKVSAGRLSDDIKVRIGIPPLPSMWSPSVLFGSGSRQTGVLTFELDDQRLQVSKEFVAKMSDLFPKDPLPDLFVPGDAAKRSTTTRPVVIMVEYPVWPLLTLAALATALLAGCAFLATAIMKPKKFLVSVDGTQRTFAMKAFGKAVVLDDRGQQVGVLRRGLGKPAASVDPDAGNISIRVL